MINKIILMLILSVLPMFASGGYDHGTSTGKNQLELDFTLNPFDIIEFGQSYIVLGYGITNRLDVHGYYSHQTDKQDNYYYGLFYQFVKSRFIDLSTAVGRRHYTESKNIDIFFPQLLYSIKLKDNMFIGGAIVNILRESESIYKYEGTAMDFTLYVPLSNVVKLPNFISELKLAIGMFNPGVFDSDFGKFLPTYSIDITFKEFRNNK